MDPARYEFLQHLHQIQHLGIALNGEAQVLGIWSPRPVGNAVPTLPGYFTLLANMLHHIHASNLRTLTLAMPLSLSEDAYDLKMRPLHVEATVPMFGPGDKSLEVAFPRYRRSALIATLPANFPREFDGLERIRRVERLVLQFPVLSAMWFDIATRDSRIWDGFVEQMFPNLQTKGILKTITTSGLTTSEYHRNEHCTHWCR